ncbi:DUF3492 domain-containing protein [Exiguobacterium sp. SH0S7]|uniref:GT4 family glycosyltransferase PelF n=1 Tax=Exiguobacterium sp. SH0S7 TaxID=2510951 RepID=UPI00103B5C2E|nr:GT4 family glycosyltransferase PelF [Exiguobacterium sp. SH0S7]TCI70350.1 DUF3492 domain-containing protein [Exiguobacterium sp. SH0S7]
MKIGLVLEGSYPYVSGGVSSWTQTLIEAMPEVEFEIISIQPSIKRPEDMKYELPQNVSGITHLYLSDMDKKAKGRMKLDAEDERKISEWLMLKNPNRQALGILGKQVPSSQAFFSSEFFWRNVKSAYAEEMNGGSFIDYFWMWQSMYMPILRVLHQPLPKVDLVHSISTGYAGVVASYMKETQGIPFILTEHGIYSREREEEILQSYWIPSPYKPRWVRFFHHLSREAYNAADEIITLFERNREYQEWIGAPSEKTKIIANGIDDRHIRATLERAENDVFQIGAIVRLVPIKDLKTMIYSAKILQERHRLFTLTIMGPLDEDEEYAEECRLLIEQSGLTDYVELVGKVNVQDWLPKFDLLLLTSISEGQPLAILEGMAAGIPWVATDVGACSELLYGRADDPFGPAGFIVPPVHPEAIADKVEWMMDYPRERMRFGKNGRERVRQYYRLQQFVDRYKAIYEARREQYGGHRV